MMIKKKSARECVLYVYVCECARVRNEQFCISSLFLPALFFHFIKDCANYIGNRDKKSRLE